MFVVITNQLDTSNSEAFIGKFSLNLDRGVNLNEVWYMINKPGGAIDSTCL